MESIKEIALKVADSLRNKVDGISHMQSNQGLVRFAEALIESYKAELLKEAVSRLAAAQEENDALRRIHKENIEILVKELSDKDYDYNQKTNRLIKRHAEQIRRCNDEVNRRRYNSDRELPDDYEV